MTVLRAIFWCCLFFAGGFVLGAILIAFPSVQVALRPKPHGFTHGQGSIDLSALHPAGEHEEYSYNRPHIQGDDTDTF